MPRLALDAGAAGASRSALVAGARRAVDAVPDLEVALVGPRAELAAAAAGRLTVVDAPATVGDDEDPAVAVRARRGASVRVAAERVRDGEADAFVSAGPVAATVTAAQFALGRRPGVRQVGLAAPLERPEGRVVVVDAGAAADAPASTLVRFAELGVALAGEGREGSVRVGLFAPLGPERAPHEAATLLGSTFGSAYTGPVDVPATLAAAADVVVTPGALGRTLVATHRTLIGDGAGAPSTPEIVVGVPGTAAVLVGPADPARVSEALCEVTRLVGGGLAAVP